MGVVLVWRCDWWLLGGKVKEREREMEKKMGVVNAVTVMVNGDSEW